MEKQLIRSDCCTTLGSETNKPPSEFLKLKDQGNLQTNTKCFQICEETEKCFERMLAARKAWKRNYRCNCSSCIGIMQHCCIICGSHKHMLHTTVENNHIQNLIKRNVKIYCKIRLYHLGKQARQNECRK